MKKIYVARRQYPEMLEEIKEFYEIIICPENYITSKKELKRRIKDVHGLISFSDTQIDKDILSSANNLKIISNYGAGIDNIDIEYATNKGIVIAHTPHIQSETNADLAFALLLSTARRIVEANNYVHSGKWNKNNPVELSGVNVNNATLGIIGLGRIGKEVAKRALGFNMQVFYFDLMQKKEIEKFLNVTFTPNLHELLSRSDFISMHVTLNQKTKHLIGKNEFKIMKPTAIFINVSRGKVINQDALYEALKSKQIAAAALDVFEEEPIPKNSPLLNLNNLILTPHIGSAVMSVTRKMMRLAIKQLLQGMKNERVEYCVNPIVYSNISRIKC